MSATVHSPQSQSDFDSLVQNAPKDTLLAISFHTPWAAPCTQMSAVFAQIAAVTPSTKATFISIDAEELPDISDTYEVTAVPFFVLLKNNETQRKISGADPKELKDAIDSLIGASSTQTTGGAASTTTTTSSSQLPPAQTTSTPSATASSDTPAEDEEPLHDRLTKLVSAAPVMLFMKGTPAAPQCGFSRQLVAILREKGIRYGFFNILKDDEVRQGLKEFSDWPTFPQLYHKGNLVGGLDIVKEELENDENFMKEGITA